MDHVTMSSSSTPTVSPSFSSMLSEFIPQLLERTDEMKRILGALPLGSHQLQARLMDDHFGGVVFDLARIMRIGRAGCLDGGQGLKFGSIREKMMNVNDASHFEKVVEDDSDVEFLPQNDENDSSGIAKDLGLEDEEMEEEEEDGDEVFDRHDPEYRVQLPLSKVNINNGSIIINKPVVSGQRKKVAVTATTATGARSIVAVSLSCRECGLGFADKTDLDVHAAAVHSVQPFRCEQNGCRKSFASKFELSHHHRKDHSFETKWSCSQCDRWYTSHPNLRHHVSMYHQLGVFRCGQCEATFEDSHRTQVYLHQMRDHSNKKKNNKVKKTIRKRKKMMSKSAAATASHKFDCGLCGLSFASVKMVNLHKRAIHGKR